MPRENLFLSAQHLRKSEQARFLPMVIFWASLVIAGLGFIVLMELLESKALLAGLPLEQLFSYKLVSYANLLLISSTILYVSHLRFTSERVGRWASGFATAGAICLTVGMLVRWIESYYLRLDSLASIANLYEVMSLFSAVTVVIYLIMEKVYRTRSAGAFVMPIVVSAVLFEIWLVSNNQAPHDFQVPLFKSLWIHAHVLANIIGYGAFAVAALLGGVYLLRHHAERNGFTPRFAIRFLPDLQSVDRLIHQAILLGFPLFTFATLLGIISAYQMWGQYWVLDLKETLALIVWLTYATYFYLRYVKCWDGVRTAWWVIVGFVITAFCFFGVNLLFSGIHVYGPLSLWRAGSK